MTSLRELLSAPRYEVIPARGTEQAVTDWVPSGAAGGPRRPGHHRARRGRGRLHLFTFNQLQAAGRWRRAALERTGTDQPRLAG